jgi:6-phosphogluconolactonase (cycloisomerase 2 family)
MKFSRRFSSADVLRSALFLGLSALHALIAVPNLSAQNATQQRVYGSYSVTTTNSLLPGYDKNPATGALTILPKGPLNDRLEGGLLAIDGQGKFLFVLNPVGDSISMFQIDGTTGELTEVLNSPFAAGATVNPNQAPSSPISIATEKNGNFLYVGYASGNSQTTAAIAPFLIDAANLRLVLTPQLSVDIPNGAPTEMMADAKGLRLYVGLGAAGNQLSSSAGTNVYSIDSTNGVLTLVGNAGGGNDTGRSIALDPKGRFFFDGWGQNTGFLDSGQISPVDGTSSANFTINLGTGVFPLLLLAENSGKFLYAQTQGGLLIYSIDQNSGALALVNGPLAQFTFAKGTSVADSMGAYIYSLTNSGVDVLQIDPLSGNLVEIPGAPFGIGSSSVVVGSQGLAVSGTATQNVSGPAAQVFPSSTDFGMVTVGKTSGTKMISLVNTGNQIMAVSGITVAGTNGADFAESSTCGATLTPNSSCTISVSFLPSLSGAEQAILQISDNAAGTPQVAAISGTGVSTAPGLTISPSSVDFGTVLTGNTAIVQTVLLTNSGTSALHISSVLLSGANPGDFSESDTCIGTAVPAQGSCSIAVSFSPKAQGKRTASITVSDDIANSPQSIGVTGTLASPFQLAAAPSSSTSAIIMAGQAAQYAMQLVPGPGFTGNVAITCSGVPVAATCNVSPATISVANANAIPFQVNVATTGNATAIPVSFRKPFGWEPILSSVGAILLLIQFAKLRRCSGFTGSMQLSSRLAVFGLTLVASVIAGCGGAGSSVPIANKVVTPAGTTTITVTATSGSLTPQSTQVTLTVQ